MEMWSKQKALAVFALVLYCFDNGSDVYVGIDLILKCHVFYGCSVLGLVLLPGFFYGWYRYFVGDGWGVDKISFQKALVYPILFIPYSIKTLYGAISGEKEKAAKYVKSMEMAFESYPQVILGMFIILGLQITQTSNYISCAISATSAVYGFGDMLAFWYNGELTEATAFSYTVYGSLATAVDCLLRAIAMSYIFSVIKAYALLLPLGYVVIMLILFCISGGNTHHTLRGGPFEVVLGTLMSFGSSATWIVGNKFVFRFRSKIVFALILIPSLCLITYYETLQIADANLNQSNSTTFAMNTTDCLSICGKDENITEYCGNLWKHHPVKIQDKWEFTLPQNHLEILIKVAIWKHNPIKIHDEWWEFTLPQNHLGILITLAILFVLSTIEGLMDGFLSCTPFNKLKEIRPGLHGTWW